MESTPEDQRDDTNDTNDLTRNFDDAEPPNKVTQVAPGTPVSMPSRNSRTSLATADLSTLNGFPAQFHAYSTVLINNHFLFSLRPHDHSLTFWSPRRRSRSRW